jgi:peptidoglycan/xylan/chitin deacetylase (PgdA/CDA1 family)
MGFLSENGYRAVSVGEAFEAANRQDAAVQKLVAITFDDGYRDFYTNAFPILHQYGYSATVFLPTAFIGDCAQRFKGEDCLTWGEVRELRNAGVNFGSHTVTHPQLRDVTPGQLREEVVVSKEQMEQRLGEQVETFCYPYAFPEADREFVGRLRGLLEETGYRLGVSTIIGRAAKSDNRFTLRRLPVNTHDDLRFFGAKLDGAYDWLHPMQYVMKLMAVKSTTKRNTAKNRLLLK